MTALFILAYAGLLLIITFVAIVAKEGDRQREMAEKRANRWHWPWYNGPILRAMDAYYEGRTRLALKSMFGRNVPSGYFVGRGWSNDPSDKEG